MKILCSLIVFVLSVIIYYCIVFVILYIGVQIFFEYEYIHNKHKINEILGWISMVSSLLICLSNKSDSDKEKKDNE